MEIKANRQNNVSRERFPSQIKYIYIYIYTWRDVAGKRFPF